MKVKNLIAVAALCAVGLAPAAHAREGAYIGLDVGVAEPTNDNFRAHVQTGVSGNPFAGYMFNDYIGLQAQGHIVALDPDNDGRRQFQNNIDNENQWTTMAGLTAGPRLQLPLGDLVDLYVTGQGGGFKGLGGRLNQWAPGFSVGGGIDFNITKNVAIGGFGRWNRAYMARIPTASKGLTRRRSPSKVRKTRSGPLVALPSSTRSVEKKRRLPHRRLLWPRQPLFRRRLPRRRSFCVTSTSTSTRTTSAPMPSQSWMKR